MHLFMYTYMLLPYLIDTFIILITYLYICINKKKYVYKYLYKHLYKHTHTSPDRLLFIN